MAIELIKISEFPQVSEPGDWIVVSDAAGTGYKISKEDFKEWLGTVTVITDKPIALADPAPTLDGVYLPTEPGTYTNAGGLVYDPEGVDAGKYVQFIKNDAVWTKLAVDLPQAENKIDDWSDEVDEYETGSQVDHAGQRWQNIMPASPSDVPGESGVWEPKIDKLARGDVFQKPSINLFDKKTLIWGKTIARTTGIISDRPNSAISALIPAEGDTVYVFSGRAALASRSVVFYDAAMNPLKPRNASTGVELTDYGISSDGAAFRSPVNAVSYQMNVVYDNVGDPDILQFEKGYTPTPYQPYGGLIPQSLIEKPTNFTEKGGSEKTAKQLDDEIQAAVQNINTLDNEVNTLDVKVNGFDVELNGMKYYVDTKTWGTSSIKDGSVTLSKAAQSLLDFINASGGGTIINQPDEHDLTKEDDVLRFKDGAEGFARIRVMGSVAEQIAEIQSKATDYGHILIQHNFDFGSTTSNKVTLQLPLGTTVRFVGEGMFSNVRLTGGMKIEAGRKQIFDNVEMTKVVFGSTDLQLTSDLQRIIIPSSFHRPIYNRSTGSIRPLGVAMEADLYFDKPMAVESQWREPYTSDGEWFWRPGASGAAQIRFEKNGSGEVYLFRSHRYVFIDKATNNILSGEYWVDPTTIKVARALNWDSMATAIVDIETTFYHPEWWGCKPEAGFDNTVFLNNCIYAVSGLNGEINFASGKTYWSSGNIVARNNVSLRGLSTIKLLPTSNRHLMIYDTMSRLNYFNMYSMTLDGNKAEQATPVHAFYMDQPVGEDIDTQVKVTTLVGYSWDLSELRNCMFINSKANGIWASIPGDVTMINCRFDGNELDGLYWHKEHFKLVECMSWGNGRYGLHTSGIHFSIIGGKFAHNGKYNMFFNGASEWQMVGVAAIDSNEHGIYITGANRFDITNARVVSSGRASIFVDSNCLNGFISVKMPYLYNLKDEPNTAQKAYNDSLPVPDTTTYKAIHNMAPDNVIVEGGMNTVLMDDIGDFEESTIAGLNAKLNVMMEAFRKAKLFGENM